LQARDAILESQIVTSIDTTATKISKNLKNTFSSLKNITDTDISSTITAQCSQLQSSIAKLPKEIVQGLPEMDKMWVKIFTK